MNNLIARVRHAIRCKMGWCEQHGDDDDDVIPTLQELTRRLDRLLAQRGDNPIENEVWPPREKQS